MRLRDLLLKKLLRIGLDSVVPAEALPKEGSEGLSHEADHNYLLHHDMEDRELDERFAGYDFENNLEYDPAYPDMRLVSDEELERLLIIMSSACEQGRDRHRPQGSRWMPQRQLQKWKATTLLSPPGFVDGTLLEGANRLKKLRQSQGSSYRQQHFKDRKIRSRPFANEPPRRMASRKRLTEVPKVFSAPKTLAQIREEKRREEEEKMEILLKEQGHLEQVKRRFSGPKPLSEILKRQKKVGFSSELESRLV
ncbi:hypothetical protein HAX54_015096 [Datura stramonium]|uniref:Uncharacterized protein n=1 Tax=Datura stramonium TaxID=4076 RepID=A0ABS8TP52_DATST|nr:hypothetical protein [Datura stramonium]